MAEAGLMPQRPWHSRQSDGEVMDGADDCDEQKGFFPEWTVFVRGGNVTDPERVSPGHTHYAGAIHYSTTWYAHARARRRGRLSTLH